jgi:hypothetical protein
VRTNQEKARYTFLGDVDYLVEDNAMDDICLSPELDGTLVCPLLNMSEGIRTSEKSEYKENDTTVNASWEQMQVPMETSRYHQEEFSFKGGSTQNSVRTIKPCNLSPISRTRFLLRVVVCNIPRFYQILGEKFRFCFT